MGARCEGLRSPIKNQIILPYFNQSYNFKKHFCTVLPTIFLTSPSEADSSPYMHHHHHHPCVEVSSKHINNMPVYVYNDIIIPHCSVLILSFNHIDIDSPVHLAVSETLSVFSTFSFYICQINLLLMCRRRKMLFIETWVSIHDIYLHRIYIVYF